jgi:hypothetical protein
MPAPRPVVNSLCQLLRIVVGKKEGKGKRGMKRQHVPHASIILIEFIRYFSASSSLVRSANSFETRLDSAPVV